MKRSIFVIFFSFLVLVTVNCLGNEGIYRLKLSDSINPVTKDLVLRAISQAEEDRAAMFIIELDTPGGLGESMRNIVMAELASSIPIVVYVAPAGARAASAGVFITMAADVAVMAPGTNIGAAHPVNLMGGAQGEKDPTMTEKVVNDTVAFAKSIAEQRGRNMEWAESAVQESSSLTATEAKEKNVIDFIAGDFDELLVMLDERGLHTAGLSVTEIRPTLRERLLSYLADPNIVYVLFILGLYGLMYEFFHPGIGFGLAAGGLCLILAFLGLQILPVNIVGVALVLFGAVLMVLDAFTPTSGILTTGGVIALLAGSFTLFDIQDRAVGLSWWTISLTVGTVTAMFVFVISKGLLAQRRATVTGRSGMQGAIGRTISELDPDGKVIVKGEYWYASSIEGRIPAGERVIVERLEAGRLWVRREI
ncbi:MAG: nodulation protein NfeD [Candidatus Bipolaricaulota bacterium]|nr:nodulation protein NfeD [Candidatus Bipolaricaulota bacterium]